MRPIATDVSRSVVCASVSGTSGYESVVHGRYTARPSVTSPTKRHCR